jgi:hypothetical protein
MPVHNTAGAEVTVNFTDQNFIIARRQGVSVKTDLRRRWWCFWLCRTPTDVDRISVEGRLTGAVSPQNVSDNCSSCGSATGWGSWFFGFFVPRAFDRVDYSGSITKRGNTGSFNGSDIA